MHWLTGSAPESSLYPMWEELGVIEGRKVIDHEEFCHVVTSSGKRVVQHSDIARFVEHLKELAPEDAAMLDRLREDVRLFGKLNHPLGAPKRQGPLAKLRMLSKIKPYLPLFKRYGVSMEQFISGFKNPVLREAMPLIVFLPSIPAMSIVMLLSILDKKQAGWPQGGSLAFSKAIEARYLSLGGTIRYGAKVEEIIVKNGRAVGVRLADGSEHAADEVIGAADGRSTIFGMLKGKYISGKLKRQYETFPLYTPLLQVSFGVKRLMSDQPRLTVYGFAQPRRFGSSPAPFALLNNYAFDPTIAPPGRTSLTVAFWSPFDLWQELSKDRAKYHEEKKRVERDTLEWLETIYPGISADVEVSDAATPMTTVRYTGNYRASYEGWRPTAGTMRAKIEKTLPGLSNFSMIGQWTAPFSGIPSVAQDGRVAIEQLCVEDGKQFVTAKA